MRRLQIRIPQPAFFAVFLLSGFSGLIYESIWSHYLKLFLGHAAYAQALVLAIFMGGMAAGAALAARFTDRIRHALTGYAVVEGLIGIAALAFHGAFIGATEWAYDVVLPGLGSPAAVEWFKWSLASVLILPQSLLLGSTFPLMSAGLVRRDPQRSGYGLSMLYFTNSLGASVGVLASGFWLIGRVGLPGTLLTAGIINILLALSVWLLARADGRDIPAADAAAPGARAPAAAASLTRVLLAVTFVSSAASFFYEIGWIRMLSLVLGSATHSFELMLSAFILGLALGSFAIRRRVDRIRQPLIVLAGIQLLMGALAAMTIPIYDGTFNLMAWGMQALGRTDPGYQMFTGLSHGIALLIMLPATVCAGMTLPLITHALLAAGAGERSIGRVYAVNTVGAIAGVILASLLVMPTLGLRAVVLAGAAADVVAGLALLAFAARAAGAAGGAWLRRPPALAAAACVAAVAGVALWAPFDPLKLSSGVFRYGALNQQQNRQVIAHYDGATASIDVMRSGSRVMIATNGKVDAGVEIGEKASSDEATMALLGALPLFYHPAPKNAAVIGFGSGYSTHVLLGDPGIERVDTIEIEPRMVAGAQAFREVLPRAFSDPRSHIRYSDAKTWFASHRQLYDIIVAEPSNPWVSGVASLFSREFYRRAGRQLRPGGVYVQWIQAYEIDLRLVSTILAALMGEFRDVQVYTASNSDLLVVASRDAPLPAPDARPFGLPEIRKALGRVGIESPDQLWRRRIAGRESIRALVASRKQQPNSDYFPVLDQGAARTRYLKLEASELLRLRTIGFLYLELLDGYRLTERSDASPRDQTQYGLMLSRAQRILDAMMPPASPKPETGASKAEISGLRNLLALESVCGGALFSVGWLNDLHIAMQATLPFVPPRTLRPALDRFEASACGRTAPVAIRDWLAFYRALDARDHKAVAEVAERMLASGISPRNDERRILGFNGAVAALTAGDAKKAAAIWAPFVDKHAPHEIERQMLDAAMRP